MTTGRSRFRGPVDVVASPVLATEEKREILVEWLEDERALLVADDEGMIGGRPSRIDAVLRALRALAS